MISGKIISSAGKLTGKYKYCYNFQKDTDVTIGCADLRKRILASWM